MTLIDGDRIVTAQLYDDEREVFTEQKMSIIDFIKCYTDEGVTMAYDNEALAEVGYWIEHTCNGMHYIECSKCSSWYLRMYLTRNNYCPNCGTRCKEG